MKYIFYAIFLNVFFATFTSCKKSSNDVEIHKFDHNMIVDTNSKLDVQVVNEIDPICGMDTKTYLKDTVTYNNKLYGFCSTMCKDKFLENPENYQKNE